MGKPVTLLEHHPATTKADGQWRVCQSVGASDYHPQLAVGSADGTCYTTNGLRATRRGGYVVSPLSHFPDSD
jgi:hypothetical protein